MRQHVRVFRNLRPQRQLMHMGRIRMRHILQRLRTKLSRRNNTMHRHIRRGMFDRTRVPGVIPNRTLTNLRNVTRIRRVLITFTGLIVRVVNSRRISQFNKVNLFTRRNRSLFRQFKIRPVINIRGLRVRTIHHHSTNISNPSITLILLISNTRST